MTKIILGTKKNVDRKAMAHKGVDARKITVYYILESLDTQWQLATYELVEEDGDRTIEIDGKYYKPVSYETNKYYSDPIDAINKYIKLRMLKPDKEINSLKELHKEMLMLKEEAKRLYGLI